MTIYDQTGKIVEKKFYHSEWKLTDLLKARNDGLLTDEGEAWKYRYSHMDGTGGKYDLLFRREPAAIEAPVQEPVAWRWRLCYREEWCWSVSKPVFSTRDLEQGTVFDVQPVYAAPQPDETAALRAKLAEMEGVRDLLSKSWGECNEALRKAEAARDEERKLADDLEQVVGAYILGADTLEVMRRHAARRKEQQG